MWSWVFLLESPKVLMYKNCWVITASRSVVSDSLWPHGLQPTRLLHPWDSPGKNTGVGCQSHWMHINNCFIFIAMLTFMLKLICHFYFILIWFLSCQEIRLQPLLQYIFVCFLSLSFWISWLYVCMSQCMSFFSDNIVKVKWVLI